MGLRRQARKGIIGMGRRRGPGGAVAPVQRRDAAQSVIKRLEQRVGAQTGRRYPAQRIAGIGHILAVRESHPGAGARQVILMAQRAADPAHVDR